MGLGQLLRWRRPPPPPQRSPTPSQSQLPAREAQYPDGGGPRWLSGVEERDEQAVAEGVAATALAALTAFVTQLNAHVTAAEDPQLSS